MRTRPSISVIIPCYNTGRYIREAVASIRAQNISFPYEIIVVDDGSTDASTHSITTQLQKERNDLRIIYGALNGGPSVARNLAIEHARCDYIFPLDSDDKLSVKPEHLAGGGYMQRAVELLEGNKDVVFAYSKKEYFGAVHSPYVYITSYDEKRLLARHNVGPFIIYRKQDAMEIGGYEPKMLHAEDWAFILGLLNARVKKGKPTDVHMFPEAYINYRIRGDGTNLTSNPKMSRQEILEAITSMYPEIYEKHYPGLSGNALIDVLKSKQQEYEDSFRMEFARECLSHPVNSYGAGAFGFAAGWLGNRIVKKWNAFTSPQDVSPVPADEPAFDPN